MSVSEDIRLNLRVQLIKLWDSHHLFIFLKFFYLSFASYCTADTMDEHRHKILMDLFFNYNVSIYLYLNFIFSKTLSLHSSFKFDFFFLPKQAQLGFQVNWNFFWFFFNDKFLFYFSQSAIKCSISSFIQFSPILFFFIFFFFIVVTEVSSFFFFFLRAGASLGIF
jgi:hypothetical protein